MKKLILTLTSGLILASSVFATGKHRNRIHHMYFNDGGVGYYNDKRVIGVYGPNYYYNDNTGQWWSRRADGVILWGNIKTDQTGAIMPRR
jgi:hypothetical protein